MRKSIEVNEGTKNPVDVFNSIFKDTYKRFTVAANRGDLNDLKENQITELIVADLIDFQGVDIKNVTKIKKMPFFDRYGL